MGHQEKPKVALSELLRESQLNLLNEWMGVNHIDPESIDYEDNLLNGIRVSGIQQSTDENWEIDFTYEEGDELTELRARKLKAWEELRDHWETQVNGWEPRNISPKGNWQVVNIKLTVKAKSRPMELLDLLVEEE